MTPFEQFASDYKNKKVLIFGLGIQGRGVGDAKIFAEVGAKVTVTDKKTAQELESSIDQLQPYEITFHLEAHSQEDILESDIILRNASVAWNHPLLELARKKNIPIKMDAALFFEYAQPKKSIGITGTRGKTTTSHLVTQLLKDNKQPAILAGNGVPFPSLGLLETYDANNWYVFELSSWQLQAFEEAKISPHIAVITNLYPDHLLDRSFDEYVSDKVAIFSHQDADDIIILNKNNSVSVALENRVISKLIWSSETLVPNEWQLNLKGEHNRENIAAALSVVEVIGLSEDLCRKTVEEFQTLPFRLESLGIIKGVEVINDSTSTTPVATSKAVQTYPNSIVILGGTTKKLPTTELIDQLNQKTKKIVLLQGSGSEEIKEHLDKAKLVGDFSNLREAIDAAFSQAEPGDVLLFSPGFTSFGMFVNEFDRGEKFNQLIKNKQQE